VRASSVIQAIGEINRPVFTSREVANIRSGSISATSQSLALLSEQGIVKKITRGVWALPSHPYFSPYMVLSFLAPGQRAYVSFLSALHLHGLIEQIPQVIYAATTGRGRIVNTSVGVYSFHQLSPRIFGGCKWYGKREDFLIAEPEKALVDSLYISSRKNKRFGIFPELHFGPGFDFQQARSWANRIPDKRIRGYVINSLDRIKATAQSSSAQRDSRNTLVRTSKNSGQ